MLIVQSAHQTTRKDCTCRLNDQR